MLNGFRKFDGMWIRQGPGARWTPLRIAENGRESTRFREAGDVDDFTGDGMKRFPQKNLNTP